jgi:hypothetical protein
VEIAREVVCRVDHAFLLGADRVGHADELTAVSGRVVLPGADVELLEPSLLLRIDHRDDAPGLGVAAGRRPGRRLEHPPQDVFGHGVRPQAPHGARGAHGLVQSDLAHAVLLCIRGLAASP